MPVWQQFIVKQALYVAVPLVAKYIGPYLSTQAKAECVEKLRALDKKTATDLDDLAVELLAQAWGVK